MNHRTRLLIVFFTALLFIPAISAGAADPAARCEAGKFRAAGVYTFCRLKADAKATGKDQPSDYSKCLATFDKAFAKVERKAGPGVCPTEGDFADVDEAVSRYASYIKNLVTAPDDGCPSHYPTRTPLQVVADLHDAIHTYDETLIACNYHSDAHLINDQGNERGEGIVGWFISLNNLFNGIPPTILQTDAFKGTVRQLYSRDGGWIVIEDGVDTFDIEAGRIRTHTSHGLFTFTAPPPP